MTYTLASLARDLDVTLLGSVSTAAVIDYSDESGQTSRVTVPLASVAATVAAFLGQITQASFYVREGNAGGYAPDGRGNVSVHVHPDGVCTECELLECECPAIERCTECDTPWNVTDGRCDRHTPTVDGTYTPSGEPVSYTRGYSVGGGVPSIIVPVGDNRAFAAAFRVQRDYAEAMGAHVGVWTRDGEVHVDVSEYTPDRTLAMRLAFRRGEFAIWDWRRMASFRVLGSTVVS